MPQTQPVQPTCDAPPIGILGVPFEPLTFDSALARIDSLIQSGESHYVATANVDFLIRARHDLELQRTLNQAALVLCDGTPILWLSRIFGNSLPERVAGSDLTPLLIERAVEKGYRIFFLGGKPEVTARAVANLEGKFPRLLIAGHYSPPFKSLLEMDNEDIARRLRDAQPDIVFVSFGCPKAEKWMAMNYKKIGVPVMIGVGATIDFLAGCVKRAPQWMRHSGTEWLYRLAQEPRRLCGRYGRDLAELGYAVTGQWWHLHSRGSSSDPGVAGVVTRDDRDQLRLKLQSRLDKHAVCRDARIWTQIQGHDCLVQMDEVKFVDSTGLALLIRLHHRLQATGHHLVLVGARRRILRALRWARLDSLLFIATDTDDAGRLITSLREENSQPVIESAIDWTLPLTWRGEVNQANAEHVWERTHEYLSLCSTRRKRTSIDMSAIRFLDSSGLSVMIRSREYAASLGLELKFTGIRPALRRLIRVSRLKSQLLAQRKLRSPSLPRPLSPPAFPVAAQA